jgi:T5SS/PEP-CTERM-associated repeat protein
MSLPCWSRAALSCCAASLLTTSLWADTTLWATDSSGNFNDPANWTGGVPDAGDDALFLRGNGITYSVTFPGRPIIQGVAQYESNVLNFGTNNVTFLQSTALNLGPSRYSLTTAIVVGAPNGPAMLTTSLGLLTAPRATFGLVGTANPTTVNVTSGTLQLTGSDSSVDELIVGNDGGATLNLSGIAQLSLTGDAGNVVVGAHTGVDGTIHLSGGQANIAGSEGGVVLGAVAGASGTIELSNSAAAWNQNSDSDDAPLVVGDLGTGTLSITAGQVNNYWGKIGNAAGSNGMAVVDGLSSTWTNRGELDVAGSGTGLLTVSNGGTVSSSAATIGSGNGGMGTVEVTGAGSLWSQATDLSVGLYLGTVVGGGDLFGVGHLMVNNEGRTDTAGDATIGSPGSAATVAGNGSLWNIGGNLDTEFGSNLLIQSGGKVVTNTAFVGRTDDGYATVDGMGSTLQVLDVLNVGQGGTGMLSVTAGGQVKSRLGFIGLRPPIFGTGSGIVDIDGAGSAWNDAEQIFIGYQSSGNLTIRDGAHVSSGTGQIGFFGTGHVGVIGAGSTWTNSESVYLGVVADGNLVVSDGGKVVVDDLLSIGPSGTLEGNSIVAAETRNGGKVSPGLSVSFNRDDFLGTLQIDGDYEQTSGGALLIDVNSATGFDKLDISGSADLSGELQVGLTNNFSPAEGSLFDILHADGGVFNTFSTTDLPALDPGLIWKVVYSNFAVQLQVVDLIPGDFSANGAVENADLTLLLNNWSKSVPPTPSGWIGQPITAPAVDNDELTVLLNNWGKSIGTGAGVGVPEPALIDQVAVLIIVILGMPTALRLWYIRTAGSALHAANAMKIEEGSSAGTALPMPAPPGPKPNCIRQIT